MFTPNLWLTRALILIVTLALCGGPELLQAQASSASPPMPVESPDASQPQATASDAASQSTVRSAPAQQDNGIVDPSRAPLQPVPPSEPAAGGSETQPATQQAPQSVTVPQKTPEAPAGAAVGERGTVAGGPASKPAGNAIAPAKQPQSRSLLIKAGLIGAAAVAIGTVVALSKASPGKPPGAR